MKRNGSIKSKISHEKKVRKLWRLIRKVACGLCAILGAWLIFTTITLVSASSQPVDAFFVLGGSIQREIHVAREAQKYPNIPILISHGSLEPCVWLLFQRQGTELQNVWLEDCANSTWENFYYGIPILRRWGVHKVKLITSPTHLPRAQWMAQILLGANGIWVEPDIVQEHGIPGNREFWQKTALDVTRSLLWAGFSQIMQPQCSKVKRLAEVDMQAWESRGFRCEHQGMLGR
ncbi:YdcF family protein [Calothrix sp. FACHB-156]|nr:YdcF family protein [Calothrix sp. FACHB-156]